MCVRSLWCSPCSRWNVGVTLPLLPQLWEPLSDLVGAQEAAEWVQGVMSQ